MSSWYYVKDGQRHGPMKREDLDACFAEGTVGGDTLVWRPGIAAWARACELEELGVPPPLPPPPLPPPSGSAAPTSSAAVEPKTIYAGFRIRLAAKFIDGAILYGVALVVERAVAALAFDGVMPVPPDWAGVWRLALLSAPANTLIAIVYTVYFMAKHEATPGKRILGLRVVRADGGRVGPLRVVGRYFAEALSTIVFFAGYVMAAFDDEKRTLHDYLCDTRVVKGPRAEPDETGRDEAR
jgi:uncharacterized RDD family membrane protein YckC